jgi:hypothetical protein
MAGGTAVKSSTAKVPVPDVWTEPTTPGAVSAQLPNVVPPAVQNTGSTIGMEVVVVEVEVLVVVVGGGGRCPEPPKPHRASAALARTNSPAKVTTVNTRDRNISPLRTTDSPRCAGVFASLRALSKEFWENA